MIWATQVADSFWPVHTGGRPSRRRLWSISHRPNTKTTVDGWFHIVICSFSAPQYTSTSAPSDWHTESRWRAGRSVGSDSCPPLWSRRRVRCWRTSAGTRWRSRRPRTLEPRKLSVLRSPWKTACFVGKPLLVTCGYYLWLLLWVRMIINKVLSPATK